MARKAKPTPVWTTSCTDWKERIVSGRSIVPCGPLFPASADEAMGVFDALRVVDVGGEPTFGDIARPWIREIVRAIFGAYDPIAGRRLIQTVMLCIAKKNGKSTLAAGVMLTALILNWRRSGEYGMLAPTIEAADNCFKPVRDMIRADAELDALFHVQEHIRTVTHRQNGGTMKVVAADSDTVTGKKWIGTLVDELWAFGSRPRARDMLLEATGGLASRPEGFVIYLSTHSAEAPAGVFLEKLQYARKVRDGLVKDKEQALRFLPVLYEFPPEMLKAGAHRDPANWHITNPNLGASVDVGVLRAKWAESEEGGEDKLREYMAKHLNVEVSLVLNGDGWPGADFWEAQVDKTITFETLLERCDVVAVGVDGGGHDDLYGLHLVGREGATGRMLSWAHAWCLPIVFERRKEIAPRLRDFQGDGDLSVVDRIEDACDQVVALIKRVEDAGKLGEFENGKKAIGLDAACIKQTLDALNEGGYPDEVLSAVSQGWRLGSVVTSTELYLSSGTLWHAEQPMMDWCVSNARIETRANSVLVTKQASGKAKVDPLMALFDAIEVLARAPATLVATADDEPAFA